jgi:hypothetical protein
MDDNNDNNERIMEDIVARGNEECSQADGFLNITMIEEGYVATEDLENNEDHIAPDLENNEDLEDANVEGSNKVYIMH